MILIQFMIILSLTLFFLLIFGMILIFYKGFLKRILIRSFQYKKIDQISEIILKNGQDEEQKIKDFELAGIKDPDFILLAEEEINLARKRRIRNLNKKSWRFWKNGKKDTIQQVPGGSVEGNGTTEAGNESGGSGSQESGGLKPIDLRSEGSRSNGNESAEVERREFKYFN